MIKTIVISLLLIIVLNFILHYLKDVFTEPIIRYIDKPIVNPIDKPIVEENEVVKEDMKNELIMFLDKR